MARYIAKRILYMIPVLLGVTLLVFFIMHLAPGNVAGMILGENATPEQIAAKGMARTFQNIKLSPTRSWPGSPILSS